MEIFVSSKNTDEVLDGKMYASNLVEVCKRLNDGDIIYLENEEYYGKLEIKNNDIKIYGKDKTVIVYDAYHSLIKREIDGGNGTDKYGTTGSASVTVLGDNFYASNVAFKNSFKRTPNIKGGQAVALKAVGNNSRFVECKFISMQDTLYVDEASYSFFDRCYIEGDVDFIFGSANAIFNNCDIAVKSPLDKCYITAPSTLKGNEYGFLFYDCKVYVLTDTLAYLTRPWYPNKEYRYPKVCFINCNFEDNVVLDYIRMKEYDPINHSLLYKNCIYKNKIVSNTNDIEKYKKFI